MLRGQVWLILLVIEKKKKKKELFYAQLRLVWNKYLKKLLKS